MMKQVTKPDYTKMKENDLRVLLNKHQQMLANKRLINALPDKGERFRTAIAEIEKCLADPSTPMDCESLTYQFDQMTMSTDEIEKPSSTVFLQRNDSKSNERSVENDFSDQRLNDVKQRLKARQAQRQSENHFTSATLITLDEAVRLYNEEKRQNEEHLLQQTTARLLGNMNLSKATFGLPPTTTTIGQTYRQTNRDFNDDNHLQRQDNADHDEEENLSDHDSDEIDYPDEHGDRDED